MNRILVLWWVLLLPSWVLAEDAAPTTEVAWTVRLDPGVALMLSEPQRAYYQPGFEFQATAALPVASFLDVELQGAYLYLPAATGSPVGVAGTAFLVGAAVRARTAWVGSRWLPFGELGVHYLHTGPLHQVGLSAGAGLLVRLSEGVLLGPAARLEFVPRLGDTATLLTAHTAVLSLGLAVEFGATRPVGPLADDTDGDGVRDDVDACAHEAGTGPDGCPVEKAPAATSGDPDHDGLLGADDRCPGVAEDFDGFEDGDGCPEPDNDRDGVLDAKDPCPLKAGPKGGNGCPDTDGDSVPDDVDACVKVAGKPENGGCPVYTQVRVTGSRVEILQKIFFAFGKDTILPRSFRLLDEVVQALQDREHLCVTIEGHTDSVGGRAANLALSGGRSRQVRAYLTEHGIAAQRLTAEGYGPDLPLDSNATTEGREKNRRVEFVIVPCR